MLLASRSVIAVIALMVIVAGCGAAAPAGPARILTVKPGTPHRLFPVGRSTNDPRACAPIGSPDSTVAYQQVVSPRLGALSLRLPSDYVALPVVPVRPGARVVSNVLVASWQTEGVAARSVRRRAVSIWAGPDGGLPTVGAPPSTRQVAFAECADAGPVPGARIATFTLITGAESTAYLAAVWPLPGRRHLQLVASAPSAAELIQVRRALLDAHTEPQVRQR